MLQAFLTIRGLILTALLNLEFSNLCRMGESYCNSLFILSITWVSKDEAIRGEESEIKGHQDLKCSHAKK